MSGRRRYFPFNLEQTVNILSEFGPLVTMFVVNGVTGNIDAGTWALLITTVIAIIVMRIVLHRLPMFPLIASTVTIVFGALTLITGNPMWVQIKVTIFNVLFAAFLLIGLYFKKNFFKYVFETTFHYTDEGWNRFTFSFAWFFVLTAVLNELVRWGFPPAPAESLVACKQLRAAAKEQCLGRYMYNVLGFKLDGVNIWILFKIAFIMPMSAIYAWFLTRIMQRHRMPDPAKPADAPAQAPLPRASHRTMVDAQRAPGRFDMRKAEPVPVTRLTSSPSDKH